jgi:glycosyltransferase involved in cell wall biosynthesis
MKKMETIIVGIASLKRGGAERVVSILTKEWAKKYHVIVTVFDPSEQAYQVGGRIIPVNCLAITSWLGKIKNVLSRYLAVRKIIQKHRPIWIFTFGESANFPYILAAKSLGCIERLKISVHNPPLRLNKLYRIPMQILYRLVKYIVVVGEKIRDDIEQYLSIPKNNIYHIPDPIDMKHITSQLGSVKEIPYKHYILALGRLEKQKGFDLLLIAYSKIKNSTDKDLVIVGSGSEHNSLSLLIDKLELSDRVHLLPSTSNPFQYYKQADLFVMSSRYEGWGLVMVEAMACGTPVVAFDCPVGPRQILDHGKYGVLVPNGDINALASEILGLLKNEMKRKKLSVLGLSRASLYDVKKIAPIWLE